MDRPIIFSAPMVRALLDGRKTQTRRLATSPLRKCAAGDRLWVRENCRAVELESGLDCIEYSATEAYEDEWGDSIENSVEASDRWGEMLMYGRSGGIGRPRRVKRDRGGIAGPWVPSIHMPRWASRLTLIVEAVRAEPLQAISEEDAIAEGIRRIGAEYGAGTKPTSFDNGPNLYTADVEGWAINAPTAVETYRLLWEWLHGADSWAANPEVVAITFRVIRANIDRITP